MRVAQSWLIDMLRRANPEWTATADEIDAAFVSVGLEVEGTPEPLPDIVGPLVIGRVSSIEELEGFKKPIRFCLVDVGRDEPQEIVCGARNFAVGDLVVVALPGTVLPGGFEIGARETYGRTSAGMICSASELGLGSDHSGIIVLRPGTATPGEPAGPVLGLDDTVIELAITPDRGYCFSLRGLTRELASGFGLAYDDPAVERGLPSGGEAWALDVAPDAGAQRFAMRRVSGVDAGAVTPWWMARRLLLAGIRPISPAVDVTNYVMLELGQPMHAFDADTIDGGLSVRRARPGETLTTLDDVERELDAEDVVICDDSGPVSMAGVMGGARTEVTSETATILLEAAVWEPLNVFRSVRRHKLPSEAAKRYERSVDAGATLAALDRSAELLAEIAGGTVEPLLTDQGGVPEMPAIDIDPELPSRVAGVDYPPGTARARLLEIGCGIEKAGEDRLRVVPPTWRPDLGQPADLVEEVLRLEGLESIPSVLPAAPAGRGLTLEQRGRRAVGRALAGSGHVEVLATPFLDPAVFDAFGLDADDERRSTMTVLNPLESDSDQLASTLLPALVGAAGRNISRGTRDLSLYAIAQVSVRTPETEGKPTPPVDRRPDDAELDALRGSLPRQNLHVATLFTGLREPYGHWGSGRAVDALDAVESARIVAGAVGVGIEVRAGAYAPFHPGRCAEIVAAGEVVGHAGELHPAVCERLEMPRRTCAMELDLTRLGVAEVLPAPTLSSYPAVLQDVALIVDADVPASEVENSLREGGGELLEDVRLFDVYTGDQIDEGKRSLAYALRFRARDRTLTDDEASAARESAVDAARRSVGAVQRG